LRSREACSNVLHRYLLSPQRAVKTSHSFPQDEGIIQKKGQEVHKMRKQVGRGQFLRGVGAAGLAGAAVMVPGVRAVKDSDIVGVWVSNFSDTTDSGGDVFKEGYLMKLDADGSVVMMASQLQTGVLGGTETKTQKLGTWVWHDSEHTKIRVMLFDMYMSDYSGITGTGLNQHGHGIEKWKLGFHEAGWDGDPEMDRETRLFEVVNGALKQVAEILIGIFGDQAHGTYNPNDPDNTSSGVVFDRYAANQANSFEPFVFKKMPNHAGDLAAFGYQ
jgi:hypothetical protein